MQGILRRAQRPEESSAQYSLRQRQLQLRFARERHLFAGSVSGTWSESTRLVAGTIAGRADSEHISVVAKAASFSASLTLTTHGARQSVVIRAHSADAGIKGVSMHLRRSG